MNGPDAPCVIRVKQHTSTIRRFDPQPDLGCGGDPAIALEAFRGGGIDGMNHIPVHLV
jgi:hypothetical protein